MKKILLTFVCAVLLGCSEEHHHEHDHESEISSVTTTAQEIGVDGLSVLNEYFGGAIVAPITIVDCTLSGGSQTKCYQFTVKPTADHAMGPWCPEKITDTAEVGGIWPTNGKAHDVDGEFVKNLAEFYQDDTWKMHDPSTGSINVTNIKVCAAVPQVNPQWTNYCMHCDVQYMDNIPNVTYTIPVKPVKTESAQRINRALPIGVAFNGVKFDVPAPIEKILGTYTIAPFDDCGGHVNVVAGYHYHEHTGCSKEVSHSHDHQPMIGIALDGFAMHSQSDAVDLDQCNGHASDKGDYHYHIKETGGNEFLGCYMGEHGCSTNEQNATCDATKIKSRRGPPRDREPKQ